jgi:hypothetical protein
MYVYCYSRTAIQKHNSVIEQSGRDKLGQNRSKETKDDWSYTNSIRQKIEDIFNLPEAEIMDVQFH